MDALSIVLSFDVSEQVGAGLRWPCFRPDRQFSTLLEVLRSHAWLHVLGCDELR